MQMTSHILLDSNEHVIGTWTLPTDVKVDVAAEKLTWVDSLNLYVNLYVSGGTTNTLNQMEEKMGRAVQSWLHAQMLDYDPQLIGAAMWQNGELLIAGLRYPQLTQNSWSLMAAYVEDSLLRNVTPLWLSQFGVVVPRDELVRGHTLQCVNTETTAEIHSRYGAVVHYHDSIDRPREHFLDIIEKVIGKYSSYTPLTGTPVYTGFDTPFQYMMHLSHKAQREQFKK